MTLRGVQFGDFQTAQDWGLIMNEKTITPPVPKTNYISVPGRDGDLDLTEALSDVVNYQNRTASFTFLLTEGTHADREALIQEILGAVHGKKLRIIDTDDYPDYYMDGRLSVTEVSNTAAYGVIKIQAICDPWRYSLNMCSKTVTVAPADGSVQILLSNRGYKTLSPLVTVAGEISLTYGGTTRILNDGTYILPGLRLAPGVTALSASGTGSIKISYTEAIF